MAISSDILGYIQASANKFGVSPSYLQKTAWIESRGNPAAYNASGASGLYQFMPGTAKQYGLSNPFDAQSSTDAAAALARDNFNYLAKKLGRAPSDGELYLAHQQGASGAYKLLSNPNALASSIVGTQAVVQNQGTPNMTASDFASKFTSQFSGDFGVSTGENGSIKITGIPSTGENDFDYAIAQSTGETGSGKAATASGFFGGDFAATASDYFERAVIIVLGLIFVAVGLKMFGVNSPVVNVVAKNIKPTA